MLLFASDLSAYIIPVIFVAIVVVLLVINFIRKTNYQRNAETMFNGLEVGDKVKTYAGIYGEIVSIRDAKDGSKVAIIKSGDEEHFSYIEIDIAAVYALDEKDVVEEVTEEEIVETEETEVQNTEVEQEQAVEQENVEEVAVEEKEEAASEEEQEEKPKKRSKKVKAE